MAQLDGRIALVTGAARGIGWAIAQRLAAEGACVIASDISSSELTEKVAELRQVSPESCALPFDLENPQAIAEAFAEIGHLYGRLDILVNNAAVSRQVDFFDLSVEDIDLIMDVNFRGSLLVMQHAARLMREARSGWIVNMSSIAGKGFRDTSNIAYAGTKGAIVIMTRIAAAHLGPFGITVNAVCPGITETALMTDWLQRRAGEAGRPIDDIRREMAGKTSLGQINEPSDIAAAVMFFVSDGSRNITGQSLNVDAGTIWD